MHVITDEEFDRIVQNTPEGQRIIITNPVSLSCAERNSLPENLTITNRLDLRSSGITRIPNNVHVQELLAENFQLHEIGDDFRTDSWLDLSLSKIRSIGRNCHFEQGLNLTQSQIELIGDGFRCGDDLILNDTSLRSFPKNAYFDGNISLIDSECRSLPDDLQCKALFLQGSAIRVLPQGLAIDETLDISDTKITKIPSDLRVKQRLNAKYLDELHFPEGFSTTATIDISDSHLDALPAGMCIGSLLMVSSTLSELPTDIEILNRLNCSDSEISVLRAGTRIHNEITAHQLLSLEIEEGFIPAQTMNLSSILQVSLPDNLYIPDSLAVKDSHVKNVPNTLRVDGSCDFSNSTFTSLPTNFKVGSILNISATNVRVIPKCLCIGNELIAEHCKDITFEAGGCLTYDVQLGESHITRFPDDIVFQDLDLSGVTFDTLPTSLHVRGILAFSEKIGALPMDLQASSVLLETETLYVSDKTKRPIAMEPEFCISVPDLSIETLIAASESFDSEVSASEERKAKACLSYAIQHATKEHQAELLNLVMQNTRYPDIREAGTKKLCELNNKLEKKQRRL